MQEQGRVMKRRNPFVQIDRKTIDDPRLSWKATGLMTYFVSKPDNWTFYMDHIIKSKTDGEKSVRSGIKELKEAGYIVRVAFRENGKVSKYVFFIYEEPVKYPSSKDIHIDLDLWNEYLEEHKDDDLIDVTEAATVIKKKKKQVSRNRQPEINKGFTQVSQKGKPEILSSVEQVACFEQAEKVEAENAGLSIFNSINLESINNYDDDVEYQSLQILFIGAGGQPIKKHETHYQTYKQALQTIGDYQRMIELANKYISTCKQGSYHATPQIVWFLSDGWRNFLAPTVTKMVRKAKVDKPLPKAMAGKIEVQLGEQELAATYEDIHATMKLLRSTEGDVLIGE